LATFLYTKAAESFLDGSTGHLSWSGDTIKLVLVKAAYTPVQATDQFRSIITAANELTGGVSVAFTGKTVTDGVADAADVTLTAVPASQVAQGFVIFQDTGVSATSRLIMYADSTKYTGLPLNTSGADVVITWDNGANKIFHHASTC